VNDILERTNFEPPTADGRRVRLRRVKWPGRAPGRSPYPTYDQEALWQLSPEQVRDLKQGTAAIEELARSELGLIAPRETYYQVVEAAPAALAAPSAPQTAPAADR
jgi:hypothetical protein